MITHEQVEAAHADLVTVGMSPDEHRLPATSLARWRAIGDNADRCEIFLSAFGLSDPTIYKLMFGEKP